MADCCLENMDQVSFNLPASNIFLLNGQTVLLQNGTINNQEGNGNDILQEELFSKNNSPKQLTRNDLESIQENMYDNAGAGFVIVKDTPKENECNLIRLTMQEAADLGIQFSVDNTPKNTIIDLQNTKNTSNLVFQKIGDTVSGDKVTETTNTVNYLTTGNINDITKLSCVNKSLHEFTLVPQYVNGQIAYAVQLTGTDQLNTTQNIGIPIQLPTVDLQTVNTAAENDFSKFVSPVAVKTVINQANKKTDTSRSSSSQNIYAPNPKVRILSKVRQDNKLISNQRKVVPTTKDKYLINRQRKLAPQKILFPPLTKNGIEYNGDNKIIRTNNVMECSEPTKPTTVTTITNNHNSSLNQPVLKVFKRKEDANKTNSPEILKNQITNQPTSLTDKPVAESPKADDVQVLNTAQGSKIAKKIIAVPSDNKSGKKLTHSQLMRIAAVLQKKSLSRSPSGDSNASTLYDLETNTKIICRVLYPEDFKTETEKTPVTGATKKRGRPLKKEPVEIEKDDKNEKSKVEKGGDRVPARTRSGRVTRPPRHMVEDYKRLKGDDSDETYSDYQSGTDENIENSPAVNLLPGLNIHQKRNFSPQFRCPTCNKIYLGHVRMALHFTKYPDHCDSKQLELLKESAACNEDFESGAGEGGKPSLRKGFVTKGKGKAQRKMFGRLALDKVLDSYNENEVKRTCGKRVTNMLSTWELLLLRLDSKDHQGKCKVQALLDELESLVKSLREVSQQILRPANCIQQPDIQLAEDTICTLLGMEKGWYCSSDESLPQPIPDLMKDSDALPTLHSHLKVHNVRSEDEDCNLASEPDALDKEIQQQHQQEIREQHQEQDSLLCKDEQDVVKVKEELSELDLLCVQDDPIGVDSVDQIVSERLKTMAPVDELVSTLPAMPAASTDELVRGLLTDDLINSLETLIPPTHPPPDLDFTVLSTEFSTPR